VPTLQAIADKQHVTLALDLEPLVPAIRGDQPRLQDALATLFGGAIRCATTGASLRLSSSRDASNVRIELEHGGVPRPNIKLALARRIVAASEGAIAQSAERLAVCFPTIRAHS
jgi:hypothetical protein